MPQQLSVNISLKDSINRIYNTLENKKNIGKIADYIPGLDKVNPNQFGICLSTIDQKMICAGDSSTPFSLQSISKVFSLALAFQQVGDQLWQRVGVEPSGSPFNSLIQLETEKGIPRNPFINAGALVICDELLSHTSEPKKQLLDFIKEISGYDITFNPKIAEAEKATSFRNLALINLMKNFGNIHHSADDVLDLYCHLCSLEMTCKQLSKTFLFLANGGTTPSMHKSILSRSKTKRINAIMQLCGFYDEAGEFSFRVGLPGKSGVGGGIIAIYPNHYSVAVWSPPLNKKGNSYKGIQALELLTTQTASSIF